MADPDTSDVITRLYAACSPTQYEILDDITVQAGLVRLCPHCDSRADADDACGECGAARPGITLSRAQLETWAGRVLTDDETDRLDHAIQNSTIPDAIGTIVDNL